MQRWGGCWLGGGIQDEKEDKPQLPPGRPTVRLCSSLPCRTLLNPQGHRRSGRHPPPSLIRSLRQTLALKPSRTLRGFLGTETLLLIQGAALVPLVSPQVGSWLLLP